MDFVFFIFFVLKKKKNLNKTQRIKNSKKKIDTNSSSLRRTVRALADPRAIPQLDAVQPGCAAMPMKSAVAHDAFAALEAIAIRDQQTGVRIAGDAGVPLSLALAVGASAADNVEEQGDAGDGNGEGGEGGEKTQQQLPPPPSSSSLALATATAQPSSSSSRPPPSFPQPSPTSIAPWFVTETKLDGYRIQVHKDESPGGFGVKFFSPRSAIEHSASRGYDVLRPLVRRLVRHERCVLDCELVVYNAAMRRVEPFGSNYRCVVFARKRDLGDPERRMLPTPGKWTEDDDGGGEGEVEDGDEDGDEEEEEMEQALAAAEVAAAAAAGLDENGAERDREGEERQRQQQQQQQRKKRFQHLDQATIEQQQQRWTTTMSATSAYTLNNRR